MDLNEFFRISLKNAAKYLANKIENKKGKKSFNETVEYICSGIYFENLEDLKVFLEEKISFLKEFENGWWGLRKYTHHTEYEIKAYSLALDVCQSFVIRFIPTKIDENEIY